MRFFLATCGALCLVACSAPGESGRNAAAPAAPAARNEAETPPPETNAAAPEPAVEVPQDDPGLQAMSPSQRRAYKQGYRDCNAGRYDPDRWPEAYRIGCGAAQERAAAEESS